MKVFLLFIPLFLLFSCTQQKNTEQHFITDKAYRQQVEEDFKKVEELAGNRAEALFSVFSDNISTEEKEALQFLYANMPLSDLADYDGDFFLTNVRLALKSKQEMVWGKQIPENIFRHFVLPYRINNENLDSSRTVFFNELKPRLEGLDLRNAILEVNHWCHEKVIYQPTDGRTIAPLSAIKSAYGRCGEESTFTVTALRSVGIPARQCYTPRWAHADDNHAWVEVWVDGSWHFIGACEPQPDLDIAWFSAPALRAMMVHSRVFGKYNGDEEVINAQEKYTKVNVLKTYAPVKNIFVKLEDANDNPIQNAVVEFQLYNYAEYYPIAKKETDITGIASIETGLGDLLVWARKDNLFSYKKISVSETDTLVLSLTESDFTERTIEWDLIPPIAREPKKVSEEGKQENERRLKEEDIIREQFITSFIDDQAVKSFSNEINLDYEECKKILNLSRGNWEEIYSFMKEAVDTNPTYVLDFLNQLSKKDLRDANSDNLIGLYKSSMQYASESPLFIPYILNPRFNTEKLIDYKSFLIKQMELQESKDTLLFIAEVKNWIQKNIKISIDNYYRVSLTPVGVYQLQLSDKFSRNMLFVAICRSFGIPARLEPASKVPQYYNTDWQSIYFELQKNKKQEKAMGKIAWSKTEGIEKDIEYRVHFSISYFEEGRYNILEYGWGKAFSELDKEIEVRAGHYLLITSNRKPDGSVLTKNRFFDVKEGETIKLDIDIRTDTQEVLPISKFDSSFEFENEEGKMLLLPKSETFVLAWVENNKETSNHTLNDIVKVKESFENNNLPIFLMFRDKTSLQAFKKSGFDLPQNLVLGINSNYSAVITNVHSLPIFSLINGEDVFFLSQGYQIGVGEQLIKINNSIQSKKTCKIQGQDL